MLIRKLSIIGVVLLAFLASCEKVPQTPPNIDKKPNVTKGVYKVVAHRGGYLECNRPDCSISSLKYAISLGCWGSECDICITGDNQVLVAHTKSGYLINGLTPYDHTLAELRAAGKLANGEELPTLQDFLNVILDKELNPNGMILQLDCKRLTKDDKEIDVNHTIRAINRACEIVQEMKAQKMVEFLIPTGTDIFNAVNSRVIDQYGIYLAWATCTNPVKYGKAGAQLNYTKVLGGNTTYSPQDYFTAGVPLVLYGVDDDEQMELVIPYYNNLRAIFTNYPAALIKKLKSKGY